MTVEILADGEKLADRAADGVEAACREAVAARGRFTVAFSGGSTPDPMLAALAGRDLPWERVHVLQVDERVAPPGHADRNVELLRRHLAPVLPQGHLHPMPVEDPDLDTAVRRYTRTLVEVVGRPPVLDLVHLGLGADGHTASLVPDDGAVARTDVDVAATGVYQGWRRLTLTRPVLDRARRLLWVVAGAGKAAAARRLVEGDDRIPAGLVARDRATVLLDREAAAAL